MPRIPDPPLGPFPGSRLTVIGIERTAPKPGNPSGRRGVRVQCECGSPERVVRLQRLLSGEVQSCGLCPDLVSARTSAAGRASRAAKTPEQLREISRAGARAVNEAQWPDGHRLSYHPLYKTWQGMMARCYNSRHVKYHNYGGRDITVCPRWHDVAAFIEDIERILGPRPEGMSLDRKRNGLGYKPSNVCWATRSQQAANKGKPWRCMLVAEQFAQVDRWKQEQAALRGA
jgi:hypothetical protein